jgi:hypothetical protein
MLGKVAFPSISYYFPPGTYLLTARSADFNLSHVPNGGFDGVEGGILLSI